MQGDVKNACPGGEEDFTDLRQVLFCCAKYMCLRTLAACCAVSQQSKDFCESEAVRQNDKLLLALIKETAPIGPSHSPEVLWRVHAIAWLLRKKTAGADAQALLAAPAELQQAFLQSHANAIIRTPGIHRRLAGALYLAGMPVSFAQLAAAAREQVLGVEVWLHINIRNGNKSSLHLEGLRHFVSTSMVGSSFGHLQEQKQFPPAPTAEELLSLAVNMEGGSGSKPVKMILDTAAAAAGGANFALTEADLGRLVATALLRGLDAVQVLRLRQFPPGAPQLTLQQLLSLSKGSSIWCREVLQALQQLPEVAALSLEEVSQLFLAGEDPKPYVLGFRSFCESLPVLQRQQLGKQQIWQLLWRAVDEEYYGLLQVLLCLDAPQQLDVDQVSALLQRVPMAAGRKPGGGQEEGCWVHVSLLQLPAAQEISLETVHKLLEQSVGGERCPSSVTDALAELPVWKQLGLSSARPSV